MSRVSLALGVAVTGSSIGALAIFHVTYFTVDSIDVLVELILSTQSYSNACNPTYVHLTIAIITLIAGRSSIGRSALAGQPDCSGFQCSPPS